MKNKRWLWLAGVGLLLIAAFCLLLLLPRGGAAPGPSAALTAAAEGLDETSLHAVLSAEGDTLNVRQTFRLQNRDGVAHGDVLLRLFAAAFASEDTSPVATAEMAAACYPGGFSAGGATVSSVTANGAKAAYFSQDGDDTCLSVTLPTAWLPDEALTLEMEYTLLLPQSAGRFGWNSGILALGNAFAQPAVWEDGAWRADPYDPVGDPFYTRCMNYDVTLVVPAGTVVAASAVSDAAQTDNGETTLHYSALAVRAFGLSLSRQYQLRQKVQDGVMISAYARSADAAAELLRYAAQALRCYSDEFGAYAYPTYTAAEVDFPFGGMEYPGYCMIAAVLLDLGGQQLEWTVAHETAHQWWYAVVGSDPVNQAWQDEGLSEYSVLLYAGRTYGDEAREELARVRLQTAMRVSTPGAVTPGSPVSYFDTLTDYAIVVYRRGAALFDALHTADAEGLRAFLRTYYQRYAFSIASRADFEALLRQQTGADYGPLLTDYLDTILNN